ncbi:DUF6787 family protein [Flavobacterium sp. 3HN19-14]|uniref:DUF6787 family protein n=1 Tax=Flavobacterium sp. 3HN19-14 TaxID=3448133 RepID=UPI003EE34F73
MSKLKERWGITSNFQLVVIFVVFAINGSLSARISAFFLDLLGITKENTNIFLYYIILLVLVLPLYPFMIIVIGWLFGQYQFFFPFAKKMLRGIGLGFVFKEKK